MEETKHKETDTIGDIQLLDYLAHENASNHNAAVRIALVRIGLVDTKVAVKYFGIISKKEYDKKTKEIIASEANILKSLAHPQIVKFYSKGKNTFKSSGVQVKKVRYLVEEYLPHGTLLEFFRKDAVPVPECLINFLFRQILSPIKYLHEKGIVHLDLKLENIGFNASFLPSLFDFGLARYLASADFKGRLHGTPGTPPYMDPYISRYGKLENGGFYGLQADIFSLGVILYGMTFKLFPFSKHEYFPSRKESIEKMTQFELLEHEKYEMFWSTPMKHRPKDLSESLISLITLMLSVNPISRCSLSDIIAHPWTKNIMISDSDGVAMIAKYLEKKS